jgi:hypothetical protein
MFLIVKNIFSLQLREGGRNYSSKYLPAFYPLQIEFFEAHKDLTLYVKSNWVEEIHDPWLTDHRFRLSKK